MKFSLKTPEHVQAFDRRRKPRTSNLERRLIMLALAVVWAWGAANVNKPEALCTTDSECAELCPEGTRDLPPDHPDYCDGGPQS